MTNPGFSTGHDVYQDELTSDAITALQRDVNHELRGEGYPVQYGQRRTTRGPARGPVERATDRITELTVGPASVAITMPPESCVWPLPGAHGHPGSNGAADGAGPSPGESAGDPGPVLFTPAQAAQLLQVRESWLRRRAARRRVPCTFLGKHLRFSCANLDQIIADAACHTAAVQRPASGTSATPRRRGRPPARARTDSRRPSR